MASPGAVVGRAKRTFAAIKAHNPWLAHLIDAYRHFGANNGNYLAAGITYLSFLALFPLILLGVSVAGFVLSRDQHLFTELTKSISRNVPGQFGTTLKQIIDTAIKNRASVGIVGLVTTALAGLGWVDNVRTAVEVVWGVKPRQRSFISKKLADTVVLAGLGLAVIVSLGLTVGGTAATGSLLKAVNLDGITGVGLLTRVVGILLGLAGDMIVFGWVIIKLPDIAVSRRLNLTTALLAAAGFEVLKVFGTYYIAKVSTSPTAGIFGSIVGVLIWINLVARYLLLCVAWAATAAELTAPTTPVSGASPNRPAPSILPLRYAAWLVGVGATLGAGALAALQRRREERG